MTIWWLAFILGALAAVFLGFVYVILAINRAGVAGGSKKSVADLDKAYSDIAEDDATHLFNTEFREELKNRGRLRFEQIIDENAMFLKQDLEMTTSQLNDYMKKAISDKLDTEFTEYARAMKEAQELALTTLQKTAADIEAQRVQMAATIAKDASEREAKVMKAYEENMAKIVEHYVVQALGDQFDIKAQLPYIVAQMEANKKDIMEDMRL
jgi:uncharacterized protein YbjQ (UPF0145 family)